MKKILLLLSFSLSIVFCYADRQISGVVVDENGEPITGASVQAKGENVGTITDIDGNFSLSVPNNTETIVFSYIGMQSVEEPVSDVMRVTMKENTEVIQEVVVTGYGNMSKGSFAGSAQAIDASEIEKKSPSELSKALAGEIAGVQVVNTSGQPGTNATIRIRGIGSLNSGTNPLYVVDGMVYEGDVSSIDPSDVASTTVLKDATATALYGSRGANGVIVITTKKGNSNDKGKIEVSASYGANMHLLPMYDVITDPKEYVEMCWQSLYNSPNASSNRASYANTWLFSSTGIPVAYNLWNLPGNQLIDATTGKFYSDVQYKPQYTNMQSWEDAMFRSGQKASANVKISGGTEKMNYYTSLGYLKDEGYYRYSDFDRFTVRSNMEFNPRKWLKGSINFNYAYTTLNNPGQRRASGSSISPTNGFYFVNCIPPIYPVYMYNEDGSIKVLDNGDLAYDYGNENGRKFSNGFNPIGLLKYDKSTTQAHHITTTGLLEVKFYKDLKLEVSAGVQYYGDNVSQIQNSFYGDAKGRGYITKTSDNLFFFEAKQLLKYNKVIGDHNIDIFAGHETNYYRYAYATGYKMDMALVDNLEWSNAISLGAMTSYTDKSTLESYLVQANYWYKERYGINGTYRADGSSNFAKGHRWGNFGSVGVAWKFTNEDFLGAAKNVLKNGKLRFSWGLLGNQSIPSSDAFRDMYEVTNSNGVIGYSQVQIGNPSITWEKASQFDVGLEFSIKKYVSFEFDYFHKMTFDMIMPRYQAPSTGFSYVYVNDGKMLNQGFEFAIKSNIIDRRSVKLDVSLVGGFYRNKIKALPDLPKDENAEGVVVESMETNGGLHVGHSVYEYNMIRFAGVNPDNGMAQYVVYYDANKGEYDPLFARNAATIESGDNYIIDVVDYRLKNKDADIRTTVSDEYTHAGYDYIGKTAEPDLEGGLIVDLEVHGVSLGISCGYRIGGYANDVTYASLMSNEGVGTYNWHVDMRNMWTESNKSSNIPKLDNGASKHQTAGDRFLTNNSYFSLNTIRLGYKFPTKWLDKIKFKKLEIYVQADNLAIATARKGYNPMVSITGQSDLTQYTPLSTIVGGIKFEF